MIVAIVDNIKFNLDPIKHTVFYADNCKRLAGSADEFFGTFKAVLAKDHDAAVIALRNQIQNWLANEIHWGKVDPADFTFGVRFSEVKDSLFWLLPSKTYCDTYKVVEQHENH